MLPSPGVWRNDMTGVTGRTKLKDRLSMGSTLYTGQLTEGGLWGRHCRHGATLASGVSGCGLPRDGAGQ